MVDVVRETAAAEAAGQPPPPFTSDWEVGQHIFDFLFAAQDASTSSLVWLITLLESHPEVRPPPCVSVGVTWLWPGVVPACHVQVLLSLGRLLMLLEIRPEEREGHSGGGAIRLLWL